MKEGETTSMPPDKSRESYRNIRQPWEMTLAEFNDEYEKVMAQVSSKEKQGRLDPEAKPYEPLTDEDRELSAKDWKAFSRQRGFSEEDIVEYERWLVLSGQADNLEGAINDPWRRGRSDWPRQLWLKHVEKALQDGEAVPDTVLKEYLAATAPKVEKAPEEAPPLPADNQKPPNEDVW